MTYVEEETTVKALEKLAKESGLNLSNLIRQATWEYAKTRRKEGEPAVTRDKERPRTKK